MKTVVRLKICEKSLGNYFLKSLEKSPEKALISLDKKPSLAVMDLFNRYWRISTNPDTSKKKYPLLKLMQESSMVPLS